VSGLERLVDERSVLVCAGAGGVGKTTTAAAIALAAARRGRRAAVVTIDPARRLANSLGLDGLGNEPTRVAVDGADGELWALMLDPKRTFDELVERHAPDASARDAVLSNRIYRELSSAVSGSHEYMAMEKLYELHEEGRFDLLVLDTPPSRSAIDFLESPRRLSRFIDSRSLQFFLAPSRTGLRLTARGTGIAFGLLKRLTGVDMLQDLSEFFQAFGEMATGFRDRAHKVDALMADPGTAFVLVTSPRADAVDEALWFRRRLAEWSLPFGAVVVNRVHEDGTVAGDVVAAAHALLGEKLGHKVARNFEDYRRLAERDRASVSRLEAELSGAPLVRVPWFDEDVHDLDGLTGMGARLGLG